MQRRLSYKDFTEEEIKSMNLRCGPCNKWYGKFVPQLWFKIPCKKHDIGYAAGKSEEDRRQSDVKLLVDMNDVIKKVPFYFKWLAQRARDMFYSAVHRYGKDSFNYSDRYATKEEIMNVLRKKK